ncbi:hypothetical protein Tco_0109727 [Tanacetum coccineum]
MSDKNDEINKKNEQDWIKVERTQDLVDYAYAKYENSWKESDEKYLSMVESEKGKAKLIVFEEMVEYVLAKYGKNWNFEDDIADVILEDLRIKYEKDDKGKRKVVDLQNRVSKCLT